MLYCNEKHQTIKLSRRKFVYILYMSVQQNYSSTFWHKFLCTVQSTVPNLTSLLSSLYIFEALRHSGSNFIHGGHH